MFRKGVNAMVMRIEPIPNGLQIWLSGELDHHAARDLREQVDAAVERSKARILRLDFSDVGFMDSSGIGLIMGRYRLMQSLGGTLAVAGMSDRIEKVMRLAGLDRLGVLPEADKTPQNTKR